MMIKKIDKAGIYKISNEEYHSGNLCSTPCLSRSVIKDLLYKSPAHAWHNNQDLNPNFKPDDHAGKFDVGTVSHDLLLEGLDCCSIINAEDWKSKVAKEAREIARLEGKTPLLKKQYDEALVMVKAAERQIYGCKELGISSLKADGDAELSYIWQEEGLWLKARPDFITTDRNILLDYKTTGTSANPSDIARHIISMGYDLQSYFYTRGVKAIEKTNPKLIFVFQEVSEPYLCSFIGLPPEFLEMAKSKVNFAIGLWRECLRMDTWPGYPNQVCYPDLPPWASASWETIAQGISL